MQVAGRDRKMHVLDDAAMGFILISNISVSGKLTKQTSELEQTIKREIKARRLSSCKDKDHYTKISIFYRTLLKTLKKRINFNECHYY